MYTNSNYYTRPNNNNNNKYSSNINGSSGGVTVLAVSKQFTKNRFGDNFIAKLFEGARSLLVYSMAYSYVP